MNRRDFLKFLAMLSGVAAFGKVKLMATNGQLLAKSLRGEKLTEAEIQQIERSVDGYDRSDKIVTSISRPDGSFGFRKVSIEEADFEISPSRAIVYSFITNGNIADNTETVLDFSDSRGYIKQGDACVVYMPTYTTRFIRNGGIRTNRDILVFGDVTWDTSGTGLRDVYINYYEADDSYLGSYTVSVTPSGDNWCTHVIYYYDFLSEGQYMTISVLQTSGITLPIISANIGFMLI